MVKKGNSHLQIVQYLLFILFSLLIIVLSVCQETSQLTGMPQEAVSADWRFTRRWSWIGGLGGRTFMLRCILKNVSTRTWTTGEQI